MAVNLAHERLGGRIQVAPSRPREAARTAIGSSGSIQISNRFSDVAIVRLAY